MSTFIFNFEKFNEPKLKQSYILKKLYTLLIQDQLIAWKKITQFLLKNSIFFEKKKRYNFPLATLSIKKKKTVCKHTRPTFKHLIKIIYIQFIQQQTFKVFFNKFIFCNLIVMSFVLIKVSVLKVQFKQINTTL